MEQMIANLGFPIASAIGLAYYFTQKDKASREDMNKIIDSLMEDNKVDREMYVESVRQFNDKLGKFDDKLDKFAIVLESNNNRLETIEDDLKIIKNKIEV